MKEAFEAIGAPDFAQRGKVTDEYINAFIELWTKDKPRFAGEHVRFENIVFAHKPVQKPHPPIWVGGESGPALRRTARLGDAWYPIGTNPINRLDSLAPAKADDGERRLFSGKPAEIAADIKALRDMGVEHLDFGFGGATVEAMLGEM